MLGDTPWPPPAPRNPNFTCVNTTTSLWPNASQAHSAERDAWPFPAFPTFHLLGLPGRQGPAHQMCRGPSARSRQQLRMAGPNPQPGERGAEHTRQRSGPTSVGRPASTDARCTPGTGGGACAAHPAAGPLPRLQSRFPQLPEDLPLGELGELGEPPEPPPRPQGLRTAPNARPQAHAWPYRCGAPGAGPPPGRAKPARLSCPQAMARHVVA